jgi:WD40 repeat protein
MAVAVSADGRQLVAGTEKGELLIWDVQERRLLKRLNQGSPIHDLAFLGDSRHIVAGGGWHDAKQPGVVRKWNIETGVFEEWKYAGFNSILAVDVNPKSGLVAAGGLDGTITIWNSATGTAVATRNLKKAITGLALREDRLFVTTIDFNNAKGKNLEDLSNSIMSFPTDRLTAPSVDVVKSLAGRLWGELAISPDGRFLSAEFADDAGQHVAWLDSKDGREVAVFTRSKAIWTADNGLLLFDSKVPAESARLDATGQITRTSLIESGKWHGAGSPSNMTGSAVSPDGKLVWEVFQLNAALIQCDLQSKACESLHDAPGLVFAMDALDRRDGDGVVATGGDDGFVRIWKLSDFSLIREFKGTKGVPQGVALMSDGRRVVFSFSDAEAPTEIFAGDIASGESVSLIKAPAPFVRVAPAGDGFIYDLEQRLILADPANGQTRREFVADSKIERFSVSRNGEWLAAADDKGALYCFEVKTGRRVSKSTTTIESLTAIVISNDGLSVWTTEFRADLRRWNTRTNTMTSIGSIRGQAKAMSLSVDEKRLAIGGNHRDVALYNAKTGDPIVSYTTPASDFYVTNAWLSGKRLIFTTDAGVLFVDLIDR